MACANEDLERRWRGSTDALPASTSEKAAIFAEIVACYGEPHRRYHGVPHLCALFDLLDAHTPKLAAARILDFAIWWHDAIYDPRAQDNEARSADLARDRLTTLGASAAEIDAVYALIIATKDHWSAPPMGEGDYMLDADIAILGAPPDVYRDYAASVRAEYAWAPGDLYRAGRSKFLSGALARPRLFRTVAFDAAYADAARRNMHDELTALGV